MSMIHEITSAVPRNKAPRRKGRGEASGRGKTSGRGHKGAKARAGTYIKRGHEGGQTPIFRRFPKRGFSNADFERRFQIVNVSQLERFDDGATVDTAMLMASGVISDEKLPVKILGDGPVSKRLTVIAGGYSRSAYQKITEAGGAAQDLKGEPFAFPKPKRRIFENQSQKKGKGAAPAAKAEKPGKGEKEPRGEQPAQVEGGEAPAAE